MKTVNEVIRLMNQTFTNRVIDYDELEEFASDLGLCFSCGETRFCIFDHSWDVVLKIPRFDNVRDDYSAIEVENYKNACKLGLERIFLECGLLTNLDCDCPIYWQVKFSCSHAQLNYRKNKKEREKVEKHRHCPIYVKVKHQMPSDRAYRDEWLCRAYQLYGKQFFKQLCVFLKENSIGDLHQENVGWKDNKPIILDFAGYHG